MEHEQEKGSTPQASGVQQGPRTPPGWNGLLLTRARAKCDRVEQPEPAPGKITGRRLIEARETRPH